MRAVLLSKDLLFISRVKEVATAKEREVFVVRSETGLTEALAGCEGGVVLIDLERSPLSYQVVSQFISHLDTSAWRCIGFYSHVHREKADDALAAGLPEVMPRSKFVQVLPSLFA